MVLSLLIQESLAIQQKMLPVCNLQQQNTDKKVIKGQTLSQLMNNSYKNNIVEPNQHT